MDRQKLARWTVETAKSVSHRKVYYHSHHIAYVVYYALALTEHKGINAVVVGALLVFTAIAAITGE